MSAVAFFFSGDASCSMFGIVQHCKARAEPLRATFCNKNVREPEIFRESRPTPGDSGSPDQLIKTEVSS